MKLGNKKRDKNILENKPTQNKFVNQNDIFIQLIDAFKFVPLNDNAETSIFMIVFNVTFI